MLYRTLLVASAFAVTASASLGADPITVPLRNAGFENPGPTHATGIAQAKTDIPKVIFDTDFSSDHDDVGDLAVLHGLASVGECEIIGMMVSSQNGGATVGLDAYNTWYGKPNIPIGRRPDVGGLGLYPAIIASEYPHGPETSPQEFPLAVNLYRQLLAESPDKSVIIATVGYLNNLEALLKSGSDRYSALNGMDLVKQKVKLWACAGGAFPSGGEFNFGVEPTAAEYVINHWPTAVTYTPYSMGHDYSTCGRLPQLSLSNPVRRVYVDIKDSYPYPSWGQTAIYQAVRGFGNLWGAVDVGSNFGFPDGNNEWRSTPDPKGPDNQAYLLGKAITPVRDGIDALIMLPPNDGTASKPGAPTDVRATVASGSQIDLQWTDNAFNETGFVIEKRSTDGASYSQIGTVGANVTSFPVTGLSSTANQGFRIKARNATGDSRYGYVWVYNGWTEINFQNAGSLPLYSYYQSSSLRWNRVGTAPDHIAQNNDSTHGQNLVIEVDTIASNTQGNLYVYFFYQDPNNWYRLNFNGAGTSKFEKRIDGTITQIGTAGNNIVSGDWSLRPWRIEVTSPGTLKFIDQGVRVLNVTDTLSFPGGKIGVGGSATAPVWENFRFASTATSTPELPPVPPIGLLVVPGDAKNTLSWSPIHGATSYTVKAKSTGSSFANIATVTSPTYIHTGLTNNTDYYYRISATNSVGEGQISHVAQGKPFPSGTGPGGSSIIGTPGSFGNHDNTILKVFDGNFNTFFDAPTASGSWAGLDWGTARVVTQVKYAPRADQPGRMVGGKFQGANAADFSDAVTLFTVASSPPVGSLTTQDVSNSTPFRYLRYLSAPNGWCNVAEVTFTVSDAGPTPTPTATPALPLIRGR